VRLIGLPANGLAFAPLVLDQQTYSDLVASTLGNMGTSGDDLDLSSQALSDLMAAFEADVTAETQADQFPAVKIFQPTVDALTAIGVEIDVADTTSIAIGSAFDFLAATFAVWGVFDQLLQDLNTFLANLASNIWNLIASQPGIGVPGIGGGDGGGGFFGG
jgi:hypothetical protein